MRQWQMVQEKCFKRNIRQRERNRNAQNNTKQDCSKQKEGVIIKNEYIYQFDNNQGQNNFQLNSVIKVLAGNCHQIIHCNQFLLTKCMRRYPSNIFCHRNICLLYLFILKNEILYSKLVFNDTIVLVFTVWSLQKYSDTIF